MIKVRSSGRIETPEKKLLRSATTALRPKTKVVLPEKHLDVGAIPKREAAAMRAAFSASESRAELRHVIDRETALREAPPPLVETAKATPKAAFGQRFVGGLPDGDGTYSDEYIIPTELRVKGVVLEFAAYKKPSPALREAPATKGQGLVDNYENLSHSQLAMGLLHEYLKTTLGVPESRLPEMVADMHAHALKLVKGEVAGRAAPVAAPAPFREALEAMTLKERRAALIEHYGLVPDEHGKYALPEKKKWENAKEGNPTPEKFLAWLDVVFPDRRKIGMVLSDLKYLAPDAYVKLHNWSNKKPKLATETIDSFGLPSKRTSYDPARDAIAPAELKKLQRSLGRAQYHHARLG
jgi:hypothetical protein